MIVLDVMGTPAPKGSGRAMLLSGKARFIASGSRANEKQLQSWDAAVRKAACDAVVIERANGPKFVGVPLEVMIVFRLVRPSGHWSKKAGGGLLPSAAARPMGKPDIDKIARATIDSLTGIIWDDDSRIVELLLRKEFADPGYEGARIIVRAVPAALHVEQERAS